jgi:aminoglycoside phosphotransferase (APT) family kinase protein
VPADAIWTPLIGGRSNQVWSIGPVSSAKQNDRLICKLYRKPDGNPLYPNLAGAEYEVLKALHTRQIAPKPIALLNFDLNEVLIYQRLDGETWSRGTRDVAELLGKLHGVSVKIPLRSLQSGSLALKKQVREIMADLHDPAPNLPADVPVARIDPLSQSSLIHTDVVASNIVVTSSGLRLIDWQCPAFGDPCEDLASFLSPAMQNLYAGAPLSCAATESFLAAYPCQKTVQRYRQLAPLFHWRMAVYCNWKAERGDQAYQAAMMQELKALDKLGGDQKQAG